jgi:hypothetical protein
MDVECARAFLSGRNRQVPVVASCRPYRHEILTRTVHTRSQLVQRSSDPAKLSVA